MHGEGHRWTIPPQLMLQGAVWPESIRPQTPLFFAEDNASPEPVPYHSRNGGSHYMQSFPNTKYVHNSQQDLRSQPLRQNFGC